MRCSSVTDEVMARALSLALSQVVGQDAVFMDVDSIALGRDFRQVLHQHLESCDLLLALIGPSPTISRTWRTATDSNSGTVDGSPMWTRCLPGWAPPVQTHNPAPQLK